MKKILYIALVALCAACTPPAVDESKLFLTEDQAQDIISEGKLLTLQQFKDSFMTEKGNYWSDTTLYRTRATKNGKIYLFSIDTISKSETPIYIRGRVTTDDQGGNFYKSLCIQEIVDGEQQAFRLSVDLGSANGLYQMGQEIIIRVDGLALGRYANQPQLCCHPITTIFTLIMLPRRSVGQQDVFQQLSSKLVHNVSVCQTRANWYMTH